VTPAPEVKAPLEQLFTDPPEWLKGQLSLDPSVRTPITAADLAELDENAQRVIAGLVAVSNGGEAALQQPRLHLQQKEPELAARERIIQQKVAGNLSWARDPRLKAQLAQLQQQQPPDDPYSPEAVDFRASQKAAEIVNSWLESITTIATEQQQAYEQQTKLAALEAAEQADLAYIDQHAADFDIPGVTENVRQLIDHNRMSLQEAHEFVMFRQSQADLSAAQKAARERARERVATGGRSPAGAYPAPPPKMSPEQRAEWLNKHPEVAGRYVDSLQSPEY
jgi:hypothetical protein